MVPAGGLSTTTGIERLETKITLAALLLAAVLILTSVHATNKGNSKHFNILNELTRHDCKQILGEPNLLLPEATGLREAYVYELGNDWQFMIYFETYGNYVRSFGIQRAELLAVDRLGFASK